MLYSALHTNPSREFAALTLAQERQQHQHHPSNDDNTDAAEIVAKETAKAIAAFAEKAKEQSERHTRVAKTNIIERHALEKEESVARSMVIDEYNTHLFALRFRIEELCGPQFLRIEAGEAVLDAWRRQTREFFATHSPSLATMIGNGAVTTSTLCDSNTNSMLMNGVRKEANKGAIGVVTAMSEKELFGPSPTAEDEARHREAAKQFYQEMMRSASLMTSTTSVSAQSNQKKDDDNEDNVVNAAATTDASRDAAKTNSSSRSVVGSHDPALIHKICLANAIARIGSAAPTPADTTAAAPSFGVGSSLATISSGGESWTRGNFRPFLPNIHEKGYRPPSSSSEAAPQDSQQQQLQQRPQSSTASSSASHPPSSHCRLPRPPSSPGRGGNGGGGGCVTAHPSATAMPTPKTPSPQPFVAASTPVHVPIQPKKEAEGEEGGVVDGGRRGADVGAPTQEALDDLAPRRPISAAYVIRKKEEEAQSPPRPQSNANTNAIVSGMPSSPRVGRPTSAFLDFPRSPAVVHNMHHYSEMYGTEAAAATHKAIASSARVPAPPPPPTNNNTVRCRPTSAAAISAASARAAIPSSAFSVHSVFQAAPTTSQKQRAERQKEQLSNLVAERDALKHQIAVDTFEKEAALERAFYREFYSEERKRVREEAALRDQRVMSRRKEHDSMFGAKAFVAGQERRARDELVLEYENVVVPTLWELKVKVLEEGRKAEYEAFLNTDEQKEIAAAKLREVKAAEKAEAKRKQLFEKEQQRLVNDCKHSKTYQSVFVGPLAKKMCLICKVKYDEKQGIYVKMR